ncbi:MAG: hypothetical protein NC483_02315 [Ruminococcus sp.]|nr:hypothetical protein [Ruminococcus sp.]
MIFLETFYCLEKTKKDIVITQIKNCYNNNLYNDSDITYITKDTSKEKEMIQYLEEKDHDIF